MLVPEKMPPPIYDITVRLFSGDDVGQYRSSFLPGIEETHIFQVQSYHRAAILDVCTIKKIVM